MGRVAVTYRVTPEDPDTDLQSLKGRVQSTFADRLRDLQEKPLAFGLVSLEFVVVLEDAAGETDRAEASLEAMDGISSVETLSVDLL